MAQRCAVPTRPGSPPVVRAPGCYQHRRGVFTFGAPPSAARHGGEKAPAQRERKGGDPKNLLSWWSLLACAFLGCPCADDCRCYTAALCALCYRSTAKARNLITVALCPSTVRYPEWWLEPDRAFATLQRPADNQGWLRGSGRSGEAGAACTPSRWAMRRFRGSANRRVAYVSRNDGTQIATFSVWSRGESNP